MKPWMELGGRYRLEQRLGRGGMGEVWRAVDLRLDRQVAVKLLYVVAEHMDQARARFRREAKAAARLNHPRITAIHDIGEHQGRPFLVFELLSGPDLAALLRDHPDGLPIETALDYAAQAAEGLTHAHAAGVIHRDVKPSNLMLDGNTALKICDFGIARIDGSTAGLTAPGFRIGTLAYMPPEQLSDEPTTGAADIYALGATLFHLLTGRRPFPADDPRVLPVQILRQDPPRPSSLRPTVSSALDAYLITLLAKDPKVRPSAHTVSGALRILATAHLLDRAEHANRTVHHPYDRAVKLAKIATVLRTPDPAKAEAMLADAVGVAHAARPLGGIYDDMNYVVWAQVAGVAGIAGVVARWDRAKADALLANAEQLARGSDRMTDFDRAEALATITARVADWSPAKAEELLADAIRLAERMPRPGARGPLHAIVGTMAGWDPPGARRLVQAIAGYPKHRRYFASLSQIVNAPHERVEPPRGDVG